MNYITIENQKYLIMKNEKNGLKQDILEEKFTDYFKNFDYIVGDWAYGKLRLKGFNNKKNPNFKPYNDIDKVEEYLISYCAYQCSYFILSKEGVEA